MRMLGATWRKSTRSNVEGSCVEAPYVDGVAQVRDTKDRSGPMLAFEPAAWTAFVECLKRDN